MSSLTISVISAVCVFGGAVVGSLLQTLLPKHHLSKDSQDTVKLGAGMVATMAALVLGLLVSSAKNSFDTISSDIAENGARIIELDRVLAEYGPETREVREMLKSSLAARIEKIWGTQKDAPSGLRAVEASNAVPVFQKKLRELAPKDDTQKSLLAQARQLNDEVVRNRVLMIEQQQESLPTPLIIILVFWLALLFISFGLFAPRNLTVFIVLFVCALSVSSSVFLILEMSRPLDGIIRVSNAPLVKALEMLGK